VGALMALGRLLLAWVLCGAWLYGWEIATRQLRKKSGAKEAVDVAPGVLGFEALWVVLFTALWFTSLGRGGWGLVLPLLALVALWTPIMGRQVRLPIAKRFVALATQSARLLVAGTLAGLLV